MFEFHGWAVLVGSHSLDGTASSMVEIRDALEAISTTFAVRGVLTPGNDLTVVHVHGLRNHRDLSIQRLFERIARQVPASYGLLYVRDQEDERGPEFQNSFRAWRLAKGQLVELPDPFLSPCDRIIESPWDPSSDA